MDRFDRKMWERRRCGRDRQARQGSLLPAEMQLRTQLSQVRRGEKKIRRVLTGCFSAEHFHIWKIEKTKGIERLQVLLSILDKLSCARQMTLVSPSPVLPEKESFADAVTRIQTLLKNTFRQTVSLNDIAQKIGMNPNAVCRLFKRSTGKTVMQYLSRLRINNACRLLIETGWPVSRIAWESGYSNLSHFNRQFRQLTGQTPSEYRQNLAE